MISCKTIIHQSDFSRRRFIEIDPEEGPVCFQLAGSDPVELGEATKRVADYGASLIDLNCGCPVKKIRSKRSGSHLLTDAKKIFHLITAMKKNTDLPVSIKIRVDGQSADKYNQEIANAVSDAGADFLVVHGRHWTENYETPCRYDEIRFFVDALNIPVIGNGDIACIDSLNEMLATGCAGIMIGRAGVGQPWLIGKLLAELNHENFTLPTTQEIGGIFLEHITRLATLLGSETQAIIQARKFAKYYARTIINKAELMDDINSCLSLNALQVICLRYF